MKWFFTLLSTAFIAAATAQPNADVVTTGPGYATQVWYSMANGEVDSAPLNNWDLAFEISGMTASIRINEQKGLSLYAAPYATGDWDNLDTAGMAQNWLRLHNDPRDWAKGAFNTLTDNPMDLGWGVYNPITHVVAGDSLYVIALADGAFKKLRIDHLAGGSYAFTFADIDGANQTSREMAKTDFPEKNFGYYNFETDEILDREPPKSDWDITFTKYTEQVGPTAMPYGVAGILHNYQVTTAEAAGVLPLEADPFDFVFHSDINTIGYDWKVFDFEAGYLIADSLSYFVKTGAEDIYQLILTGFEGSATGVYAFSVELVSSAAVADEAEMTKFDIYPNPSKGNPVQIVWSESDYRQLRVFSTGGSLLLTQEISDPSGQTTLDNHGLAPGVYLVQLSGKQGASTQKLVIAD